MLPIYVSMGGGGWGCMVGLTQWTTHHKTATFSEHCLGRRDMAEEEQLSSMGLVDMLSGWMCSSCLSIVFINNLKETCLGLS